MARKLNLLYGNHILVWHKMLGAGTMSKSIFGQTQEKIEPAQNDLGPVEGQG